MGLGQLLEACRVHEKVALEHSSKSTKYELEGSYDDLVHELSWTYHTHLVFYLYQCHFFLFLLMSCIFDFLTLSLNYFTMPIVFAMFFLPRLHDSPNAQKDPVLST